jgi:hypothetical protein
VRFFVRRHAVRVTPVTASPNLAKHQHNKKKTKNYHYAAPLPRTSNTDLHQLTTHRTGRQAGEGTTAPQHLSSMLPS